MKLLFDEHISFRVVRALQDVVPESRHVKFHNLQQDSDEAIWDFAKANGYIIVSRDDDFHQRSLALGHPPKVVWLKIENCSRDVLEQFVREHLDTIRAFATDADASLLVLS